MLHSLYRYWWYNIVSFLESNDSNVFSKRFFFFPCLAFLFRGLDKQGLCYDNGRGMCYKTTMTNGKIYNWCPSGQRFFNVYESFVRPLPFFWNMYPNSFRGLFGWFSWSFFVLLYEKSTMTL